MMAGLTKYAAGAQKYRIRPAQRLRREELRLEVLGEDDDRFELLDLVGRLGVARVLDERLGARAELDELGPFVASRGCR
jgi:hypothetical protein